MPTYQSYMDHAGEFLPLIIRLEPSNINFHADVLVQGTYMPWRTPTSWEHWTIAPAYEHFGNVSVYTTPQGRKRISYGAPHFSDWMVGDPEVPTQIFWE